MEVGDIEAPQAVGTADATRHSETMLRAFCALQAAMILIRLLALAGIRTRFWAFALPAYLPMPLALVSVLAPVVLLVPWLARFSGLGARARPERTSAGLSRAWPLALAPLVVLLLPDQSGFMGDYLLRRGAVLAGGYASTFPQSLWLDRVIQGQILPALGADPTGKALDGGRWLGLLACLALAFVTARALAQDPPRSRWGLLSAMTLVMSGYLCIFTGFMRDTVELLPLVLLFMMSLRERVSGSRALSVVPELALALALGLHRSALALIPAYAYATIARIRRDGIPPDSGRWRVAVLGLLIAAVALAPGYAHTIRTFDLPRHLTWLDGTGGARPPFTDARFLLDLANALMLLAPASFAVFLLASRTSPGEHGLGLAFLVGWLPMVLFMRPQQGVFRDYDVYAGGALVLAWLALLPLRAAAERGATGRWALLLTALSAFQAAFGLLIVSTYSPATEARVRHGLALADRGERRERAGMYEYLGINAERREEWRAASVDCDSAASLLPSPARLLRAGRTAACARDWRTARNWFGVMTSRDSSSVTAWCGYVAACSALGDTAASGAALEHLVRLARTPRQRATALALLSYTPALDSSGALRRAIVARAMP